SGVIQTVSTLAVAIATIVYAFLTYRMAGIMSRDISLRFTPYVSIGEDITMIMQKSLTDESKLEDKTNFVRFTYTVKNVGNLPIQYISQSHFNEDYSTIDEKDEGVILQPGQLMYTYTKTFYINEVSPHDISGIAGLKITYWALNNSHKKFTLSRDFNIEKGAH